MASNKEASHPQAAKNITQEELGLSDQTNRMLQSQHKHVHGALESDDQRDHIVKDVGDEGSGDVVDKCPGVNQQADHFKCGHWERCST